MTGSVGCAFGPWPGRGVAGVGLGAWPLLGGVPPTRPARVGRATRGAIARQRRGSPRYAARVHYIIRAREQESSARVTPSRARTAPARARRARRGRYLRETAAARSSSGAAGRSSPHARDTRSGRAPGAWRRCTARCRPTAGPSPACARIYEDEEVAGERSRPSSASRARWGRRSPSAKPGVHQFF